LNQPFKRPSTHLGQCRLGLALVLRYGLDRLALGGDLVGRHIVAVQVGGAGEGDMDRKVVGELGVPPSSSMATR